MNLKDLINSEYIEQKFLPFFEQSPSPLQVNRRRAYLKATSKYDLLHFNICYALIQYLNK